MTRPRVVVVGCGFGGLAAVRALAREAVETTLIDRTNHHLFQPLLYQVAAASLTAPAIAAPIRHVLRREMRRGNLTVLQAEVVDVDATQREVVLHDGERIAYDHLIVAAGATHSYFGHDGWAAYAPGLKTLADAFDIRARVIHAFESAERCPGDDGQRNAERAAWLTFVVIGAGPTGVEMAGTLIEMARHTLAREFRRIDSRKARVVLLEGGERVLANFVPAQSQQARAQLERLGVEVRTGCKVTHIDACGVRFEAAAEGAGLAQTHAIESRTVIWAAGVAAAPLGRRLADATGVALDRAGRVGVEPDLGLAGYPEISVVGDLAAARSHRGDGPPTTVPGVSPAAKQMGRTAAANVLRRVRGEATQAFVYADYGNLATIGRRAAVVDLDAPVIGALRFSGYPAWVFWLFAHIYFLIGFRNRLLVLAEWAWAYWTFERNARVVAEAPSLAPGDEPPPPTSP